MSETRKITLQFPSLRAFLAEYGERISVEGMLLRGEAPPAAGSTVDIEVVVAEGMRLLRARGETLWSGAAGAGSSQRAAAVRFRDMDEASRTLIAKIVDQRRREGAEPFQLADVPGPREARLRDLTVPAAAIAAGPAEPDGAAAGAIFDLAQAPAAAATDLFEPLAAGEPALPDPEPSKPEPKAPEPTASDLFASQPPAPERKLEAPPERARQAPVPLLADPEPDPFDLGAPEDEERTASAAMESDLTDLFGGDEPQWAPARGRTEAFPPSFVDEVEAELRAAEAPEGSYREVDTGELEIQLDAPPPAPEPTPEPTRKPTPEPIPTPPPESASEAPAAAAPELEIEVQPEAAPEPEVVVEPPTAPEPEIEIELDQAPKPAAGLSLEPEPQPEIVLQPGPEIELESQPEPAPEPEPAPKSKAESSPLAAPEPPPGPGTPQDPDLAARVAQAFDAAKGPETVEIPILAPPASPSGSPARRPPAPPPQAPAPPPQAAAPAPPDTAPAPAALMDDNLLSIPELGADPPAAAPDPAIRDDLPSSAQALRGAAGSSRHLGTWLLIALLVGALAVAGYFWWGLARDDGGPSPTAERANAPVPPPARPAAGPAEPAAPSAADTAGLAGAPPPADAGPSPPGEQADTAPAEQPPPAAPVGTDPPAPLTGLDRITWNEIGAETVLALVGDGEIARGDVELVTLSGGQPRLVIKISGVRRAFQPAVLEVGTTQVARVRTGLHADGELHVVVDLAAAGVAVRDLAVRGPRVELRLGAQ